MSRMVTPAGGGFGGQRVVKPQANVYTILLLVACLFVVVALVWELGFALPAVKNAPPAPAPPAKRTASVQTVAVAASPIQHVG